MEQRSNLAVLPAKNNQSTAFDVTGTSSYSEFIHLSRYSRWLEEKGRRETWDETVERYVSFFVERHPELAGEIRPLGRYIREFKTMPSMRALMTAGPALKRDEVAGYNCLGGETLVTTKEYGIAPISSLADKDVHIVDGNGEWVLAHCRSYGKQDLFRITFSTSGRGEFSVRSTGNHLWIRKDGSKCFTEELRPDDRLAAVAMPSRPEVDVTTNDYRKGIIHGLVYGDGTTQYKQSSGRSFKQAYITRVCKGFSIRLCSDAQDLLPYFAGYTVGYPPSFNGDPVVYLFDSGIDLKTHPDVSTGFFTDEYLVGFIRGWLAADGSVSSSHQVSLAATNVGLAWINSVGPRLGFVSRGEDQYPEETNLGVRSETLNRIRLDRRWLLSEDFIIGRKRANFKAIDVRKHPGFGKVAGIEFSAREEVFCFDVPTTHSFLLTRNLLTGNCAFLTVDHPRAFDETMYILMCGTGVGFSVERQYVSKLPEVAEELHESDTVINVKDSRIGWAASLRELISLLYNGQVPKWNLDKIRPAGARLKTFGGRASGPEPLNDLFKFCVSLFSKATGRKLSSIECHDLVCKIAEIVVVGGVRRSALLSLSNVSDDRMRRAKAGQWFSNHKQRQLANNSACYTERPDFSVFLAEWISLHESKSGERGVFSRVAARRQVERNGRRDPNYEFGTNPCSEIILRPDQFCNLSEVVVRPGDSVEDLLDKVRVAAILGTLQSTLIKFRYLRRVWHKNTQEERLLGVSLTGIMDHPVLGDANNAELPAILQRLRDHAVETNRIWAEKIGIPQSTAVTCVKPSGTVSQLVNSSSGIHPRFSPYYIRRVRIDKKQPLADFMTERGFPYEVDVGNPGTLVFEFPIQSPKNSVVVNDVDAIQQLNLWTTYQENWCEHKPSCTVYYRDANFLHVGAWIWDNFDKVSGVTFYPHSDHVYQQAPYEEITEEEYLRRVAELPSVNWADFGEYEDTDHTVGSHTLACSGGMCEVVDLVQAS